MTHKIKNYVGINLHNSIHGEETNDQAEVSVFGFWVFIMSDMITFAILFATYSASTNAFGFAGGPEPKQLFSLSSAGLQTAVLLLSSLTCGMASVAMKYKQDNGKIGMWLALTGLLGLIFIGLSLSDFNKMIAEGAGPSRSGWLSSYFALVGLHLLHMIAGITWILVMFGLMFKQGWTVLNTTRMLNFAVFWHFIDIVWVGIFSIVFLGGLA